MECPPVLLHPQRFALFSVACILLVGACVPWTVHPIDEEPANSAQGSFDARAYVETIWESKVVPTITNSAVEVSSLADVRISEAESAVVKGSGRVLEVDERSRSRLLMLDLRPYDNQPDVSIQVGPVIRGTSLRDALSFIRFTDFLNQIQFAEVANELNRRVLEEVLAQLDLSSIRGRALTFYGACSAGRQSDGDLIVQDVVPVQLIFEAEGS